MTRTARFLLSLSLVLGTGFPSVAQNTYVGPTMLPAAPGAIDGGNPFQGLGRSDDPGPSRERQFGFPTYNGTGFNANGMEDRPAPTFYSDSYAQYSHPTSSAGYSETAPYSGNFDFNSPANRANASGPPGYGSGTSFSDSYRNSSFDSGGYGIGGFGGGSSAGGGSGINGPAVYSAGPGYGDVGSGGSYSGVTGSGANNSGANGTGNGGMNSGSLSNGGMANGSSNSFSNSPQTPGGFIPTSLLDSPSSVPGTNTAIQQGASSYGQSTNSNSQLYAPGFGGQAGYAAQLTPNDISAASPTTGIVNSLGYQANPNMQIPSPTSGGSIDPGLNRSSSFGQTQNSRPGMNVGNSGGSGANGNGNGNSGGSGSGSASGNGVNGNGNGTGVRNGSSNGNSRNGKVATNNNNNNNNNNTSRNQSQNSQWGDNDWSAGFSSIDKMIDGSPKPQGPPTQADTDGSLPVSQAVSHTAHTGTSSPFNEQKKANPLTGPLADVKAGRLPEAIKSLDKVLQSEPTNANAHYLKGVACVMMRNFAEANKEYAAALKYSHSEELTERARAGLSKLNR